jgi:hypothetical protein
MSWSQPNRYDDIQSRRDAARILKDASDPNPHPHGDDDESSSPWYRNPWVWASIVVCVLIVAWFVATFA